MEWYYLKDGRTLGPVPEQSIRAWLASGFLTGDDLLWHTGMAGWTRVDALPEFGGQATGAPGAPGGIFSGVTLPPPAGYAAYAGFWLRAGAYLIDSILLAIVLMIVWFPQISKMTDPMDLQKDTKLLAVAFVMSWFYYAVFESSRLQGTPGKKAFRLKVTDLDGRRINFFRATMRHWGKLVSGLLFYVGYVMAGFTPRRQALHDMMAGCLVVRE